MDLATVFVSSIEREYAHVRQAAKSAVESLGLRAVMAEDAPASTADPRTALLRLVEISDAFVIIIGPRYGDINASGLSATEDEFEHARKRGKPILVFVDDAPRDAEQEAFLTRVQGTWGSAEGKFAPRFADEVQLVTLMVRSLRELQMQSGSANTATAQSLAVELARGDRRSQGFGGGARLRVVLVPVGGAVILDAVALEDHTLLEYLMGAVRSHGLVPQASGLESNVRAEGIRLSAPGTGRWDPTEMMIGADGTVVVEGDVAAEGMLGSSQLLAPRAETLIADAATFAGVAWDRIDPDGRIRQVGIRIEPVCVAVTHSLC